MLALIGKIAEQLGPFDKWGITALEAYRGWMADSTKDVERELLNRQTDNKDNKS